MKQIVTLLILFLFIMQLVAAQKNDTSSLRSPQALHDSYMHKYKTNHIIAWSCLGAGTAMLIGGIAIKVNNGLLSNNSQGQWLTYLGFGTTLASIPFFISAGRNKRQARLALKAQSISIGNNTLNQLKYKAVVLTVPL
jgi:hypothetical protein